jgi:hypothetical protein
LTFFNFGEKIIKWILAICTGRQACIIFSDSQTGKPFNLERGNAQGDVISPFIFNICYQILIFKLELNLQIEKLDILPEETQNGLNPENPDPRIPNIPDNNIPVDPNPVSYTTKKVFAFADDCNVLTTDNRQSIAEIMDAVEQFGIMSGLVCNIDKSSILRIGNELTPRIELENLGFMICDEITVLGFKISNSVGLIENNTGTLISKIEKQKRIWTRYNLSLPGRIEVCKTMFYSQLNYIGGILPVDNDIIANIENAICTFVRGKLNIAKQRIFSETCKGGLGLFDVKKIFRRPNLQLDQKVQSSGSGLEKDPAKYRYGSRKYHPFRYPSGHFPNFA